MKAIAFVYQLLRGLALAVVWLGIGIILLCATIVLAAIGAAAGSAIVGTIIVIFAGFAAVEIWESIRERYR